MGHYFAINESMGDGHRLKLVALVSLFTGTVFIGRGRRDPRIETHFLPPLHIHTSLLMFPEDNFTSTFLFLIESYL